MLVFIRIRIDKMLVGMANREDRDQKQSDLLMRCLSMQIVFEILDHLPQRLIEIITDPSKIHSRILVNIVLSGE